MKIYIVVIDDRHCDTDVKPFSDKEKAIEYAKEQVQSNARQPEDIDEPELNASMVKEGWVYYATYSCESDSVTVIERELI